MDKLNNRVTNTSYIPGDTDVADPVRLISTVSVESAMNRFKSDEPIDAAAFTRAILETYDHKDEYASGNFSSLNLRETIQKRSTSEWLVEIEYLFDPQRIMELEKTNRSPMLHGRLAIVGLCLLDRQLRQQLEEASVFDILVQEIKPPLVDFLSEHGRDLYYYELPTSVSILGDDPVKTTADDRLGRVSFAKYLARRISAISMEEDAYVMHIYAPWGAGKSSLLRFLREELEKNKGETGEVEKEGEQQNNYLQHKWLVVEFNAWLHQRIEPPWWSLLDRVYIGTRKNLKWHHRFQEWAWRIKIMNMVPIIVAILLAWLTVIYIPGIWQTLIAPLEGENQTLFQTLTKLADLVKAFGIILAFIGTIWGGIMAINRSLFLNSAKAAQEYQDRVRDPMNKIKARFKKLIDHLKPCRVVVIIDDLDRCHSNYVVELLEGIQTLFREVPVVFIIAGDRCWLNACYEQVYDKLKPQVSKPGKSIGDLFLEKAFRFSTPLPGIPKELKQQYWDYILQIKNTEQESTWKTARQEAQSLFTRTTNEGVFERHISANQSQPFPKRRAIREAAVEQLALPGTVARIEHSLQKYIDLLETNPRALKRLANAYSANLALKYLSEVEIDRHQLVLWTILSSRWPHLAAKLLENPDMVNDLVDEKINYLSDNWKNVIGNDQAEIQKVVRGIGDSPYLTAETINNCRLMQA